MKIFMIIIALLLGYVIWQYFELKKFQVTEYSLSSGKLSGEHRLAVIADLHGFEYGRENQNLIQKVKEIKPDFILIAGDMIVSKYPDSYQTALRTLRQLVEIAPVYYGFGNHESRANKSGLTVSEDFLAYCREAETMGVQFLRNENLLVKSEKDMLRIGGIEIDLSFYEKKKITPMGDGCVEKMMGPVDTGAFQILLAHHPGYSEQYAAWGADLTFCGHNHGGLVRIPGIGSLLSPQLTFFPKYNDGLYEIHGKRVIVSRGLGTHTFHIRVFNRAELIAVRLFPNTLEKTCENE